MKKIVKILLVVTCLTVPILITGCFFDQQKMTYVSVQYYSNCIIVNVEPNDNCSGQTIKATDFAIEKNGNKIQADAVNNSSSDTISGYPRPDTIKVRFNGLYLNNETIKIFYKGKELVYGQETKVKI